MSKILEKLNNFQDLSETNIIERIKAILKEEDPDKYKEWEESNFSPNHLFELGDNRVGTLLHLACWCNDERIVKLLIDTRIIDVNKQGGYWKMSPLMVAADESSPLIVRMLLNAGADPSATNDWDDSVIYQREEDSITRIHADLIIQFTLLLNPQEEEIDGLDLADKTKYWHDCKDAAQKMQSNDPLLREFLLETDETKLADHLNNSDMREKLKTGQYERKYLPYADLIESQHEKAREKVKERFLHSVGALINYLSKRYKCNFDNMTPTEMEDFLEKHKNESLDIMEDSELPPLGSFINASHLHSPLPLKTLALNQEIPNQLNKQLFVAIREDNKNQIKMLLEEGADVNAPNDEGDIPLYSAIKNGRINIIKVLLKNGADVNAGNIWIPVEVTKEKKVIRAYAVIVQHIEKLRIAGLPVSLENSQQKENFIIHHSHHSYIIHPFHEHSEACKAEVEKMQNENIGKSGISYHQFLIETDEAKLVGYLSNPDVREELEKGQYKEKFPLYADLIESQYERGIELWRMQELTTSLEGTGLTQVQSEVVQK